MQRELWVRPTGNAKKVAGAALEAGAEVVLADAATAEAARGVGRVRIARIEGDRILLEGRDARLVEIRSPQDQDAARALVGKVETLVVVARDWTVIPLENLVAWTHGTRTRVFAQVADAREAELALGTLERGVHGLVVATDSAAVVKEVAARLAASASSKVALVTARVTAIEEAAMGDRVCVDTTSLLAPDEGLLVGSGSAFLALVASEASEAGYVASRPFRVNAGAVHAYVRAPEDKTHYLSEVRAGTRLLAVRADGTARVVTTGRAKVERRPMLLLRLAAERATGSVVVQNAETIRLVTPKGVRSVAELAVGDEVLVHLGHATGRHFGTAVDESIREV